MTTQEVLDALRDRGPWKLTGLMIRSVKQYTEADKWGDGSTYLMDRCPLAVLSDKPTNGDISRFADALGIDEDDVSLLIDAGDGSPPSQWDGKWRDGRGYPMSKPVTGPRLERYNQLRADMLEACGLEGVVREWIVRSNPRP